MLGTTSINAGATSWSNFWGGANSYSLLNARAAELAISRALMPAQFRSLRAVMRTLNGTAAGSTATATYARISAPAGLTDSEDFGGARVVDTITDINRATTAADVTYIDGLITRLASANPSTYATDASGNGGGGKVGV